MQRRPFGKTGIELSLVGLGGVVLVDKTHEEANEIVANAFSKGVNYYDVAPSYGRDQETEIKLGPALKPYRDEAFLACKTTRRDKEGAKAELERSLKHLETDHFDLYQLHAITTKEEVDQAFAPGGAMEAVLEAQQAGKIKHIGFSAHSVEAAFLALDYYDFVSALFPINFVNFFQGGFGEQIIAKAEAKGTARLALKAMAKTNWKEGQARPFQHCWYEPISDPYFSELSLRWTLSQKVTAAVPPGHQGLFEMAVEYASRFTPVSANEIAELRNYAEGLQPLFKAA